jgi:DNA-binding CsgD family transcriptional regulator
MVDAEATPDLSDLTPRQREAWELHLTGSTAHEIATQLGISDNRAYELVAAARRRLGLATSEKVGIQEVIEAASPTIEEVRKLALEEGIEPQAVRGFVERMNRAGLGVPTDLREVTVPQLLKLMGDRALQLIESVDVNAIADAKLRDKMVAFGILVDKLQLLSGQPTQRLDISDRRKMDELVIAMVAEAKCRGIKFDPSGTPLSSKQALPESVGH